ncbi:hypothetical protein F5Y10DRAFT_293339 [Nemania abortiva]|nr:hypothetical protein F5Y10DRAFT_293339 [Nemania abortiva]
MYLSSLLASRGPSQVVIPAYHNIVDPEVVDVDDSDEDGPERDAGESKTGTLGSFRTRLIRRLSHRVDTKAGSRPSAGTSGEELARRAELKRLMHKRIQEELKSEEEEEEENDDGDPRPTQPKRHSINNCREPELHGGGPRDTIEFAVSGADEQETGKEGTTVPETSLPLKPVVDGPQGSHAQRTICSESAKMSTNDSYHECNASFNEVESIMRSPSPLHLTPVHLLGGNGRESPSTTSWRLSYSEIHIESYIEPLVEARQVSSPPSPEPEPENAPPKQESNATHPHEADVTTNCSNLTMHDETVDTSQTMQINQGVAHERNYKESDISSDLVEATDGRYSPLDVWLRSQDLHCASILSSRPNSEMALENYEYDPQEEFEALQKTEASTELSMYKDQSTNRSSILQEHTSGVWPKPAKNIVDGPKPSITAPSNESIALHEVLDRMENVFLPEEPPMEDQIQDVSSRYTSSRYTTRPNSQQPSRRGSRLSLAELLIGRKIPQSLNLVYDISSYQTALNKTPSDHAKSNPELSQFHKSETFSAGASETASFRQREEELKSIKKRFGLTPARRHAMAPVRSKFREEFEGPKGSNNGKNSIFSKLYFAFPRRVRGSDSHAELSKSNEGTGIRSIDFRKHNKTNLAVLGSNGDHCLLPNMASDVCPEDRATEHRDIKQEADHHPKATMPIENMENTEARYIPVNNSRPGIAKSSGASESREEPVEDSSPSSKSPNDMATLNKGTIDNAVTIHAGVLQEWVGQLRAEDTRRQNRTESRINVSKRQPPRFRTPPQSWAKWPSHTRGERTASAGEKDKVNSRDFAVVVNPRSSEIEAGREVLSTGTDSATIPRTLSSQVGKALKSSWNKMVTHTASLDRSPDNGPTTRTTKEPHGFLEYPELELLPTAECYREVQALGQQIGTMKRWSTSGRKAMQQSSSDGTRHPLASRIAEGIHRFQTEDQNTAWTEIEHRVKIPPTTHFLSSAHSLFTRRSKSCDPELFGAPEPQSTYEDCVQTHMLHDDGDININKGHNRTIKRAKSTGNIEAKLLSDVPLVNENTPGNHGPAHKAGKSGLRRHKSLGWIRGRTRAGDEDKPAVVK